MPEPILSASQVSTFGTELQVSTTNPGCQRKWGLKYLGGYPDPPGQSAAHGTEVHALLAQWLQNGIMPKGTLSTHKLARAMIKHLPPPPQRRVEESFTFELDGVKYRGFKDLVYRDGNTLVIHDHKTTSGLQWAKSEEDLRKDTQALLYARHGFQEADVVDLEWLYGTRETTPRVLPVRFNILFSDVQAALPAVTRAGKRILELYREAPDPNTLEPNLEMCDALGGCPFKNNGCNISAIDRVRAKQKQFNKKEEQLMGFRDRMKKEVIDTVGVTVSEIEAPVKPSMRERLKGFGSSVTPPEFERPAPPPEAPIETEGDVHLSDDKPKAKRGRPRKAPKEDAPGLSQAGIFNTDAPDHVPIVKPLIPGGFILCVNSFPGKAPYRRFSELIVPVLADIQSEHGVIDFRQIDYKGAGILAAALYTYLEQNPITGHLLVDARTDEGRACLPTLERFAKEVYRGYA